MARKLEIIGSNVGEGEVFRFFLRQAYLFARSSNDPSTQVGAVIVHAKSGIISGACNSAPSGLSVSEEQLVNTTEKEIIMEHAERNAIYKCAASSLSSVGCHMYTTLPPCFECARGIIQAGITQVVAHKQMLDVYGETSIKSKRLEQGLHMLLQAGIRCVLWDGKIFTTPLTTVLVRGKSWNP